jgi:hypothetical protein
MKNLYLLGLLLIFLVGCTSSQGFLTYTGEELELDDYEIRKEQVGVNLDLLEEDRVNIDIFGGEYVMVKEKVEYNEDIDSYSWHGSLEGESESSIILVYDEDSMVGNIWNYLPGDVKIYNIEGNADIGFSISEVDQSLIVEPD